MRIVVVSALVVTAVLAASASGSAADLYVAPGGSSGASGSMSSPFDTLQNALSRARPGDNVLVRAGTYRGGGWISARGTASAPITIRSVDGPRRAIMEGGTETLRIGDGAAYLIFDGLEIRRSGDNTIHIDGRSNHITLRNIFAHDAGPNGDVVKINQCSNITIESSELARPGPRPGGENPYQECIDFVHVTGVTVRDCYIHDGGSSLIYAKGGSRDVVFERNVISEQRAGASDPMVGLGGATDPALFEGEQFEVINVVFRNNILFGGIAGALAVYDAQGAYIVNNLFYNNGRVLVEFRAGQGPSGRSERVRSVNNLFVDTRGMMPEPYRRSSHGLNDFTTSNNLFWNNGAAIPRASLVDLASQPGHLAANPGVGSIVAGNRMEIITLPRPSGGPAANSGADSSGAPFLVTDDILRTPRGTRRDRGPWLLSGSLPPPDAGVVMDVPPPRDVPAVIDRGLPVGEDVPFTVMEDSSLPGDMGTEPPRVDSSVRDASVRDAPVNPPTDLAFTDLGLGDVRSPGTDTGTPVDEAGDGDPAMPPGGCTCELSGGVTGPRAGLWGLALLALTRPRSRRLWFSKD